MQAARDYQSDHKSYSDKHEARAHRTLTPMPMEVLMTALAKEEAPMPPANTATPEADLMQRILAAPGLPPDASPEQIADAFARLDTLRQLMTGKPPETDKAPDPAKFVPAAAVAEMLADRNKAISAVAEDRAAHKVADALRRGLSRLGCGVGPPPCAQPMKPRSMASWPAPPRPMPACRRQSTSQVRRRRAVRGPGMRRQTPCAPNLAWHPVQSAVDHWAGW